MAYERKDPYWRKAKQEGYRSRAAYKLLELQKRFGVIRKGHKVLDLGCAPGGWLQVISEAVGPHGRVVGVDRNPVLMAGLRANVSVLRGDASDPEVLARAKASMGGPVDVVTSDMAPDLSGVGFRDHARSCEIVRLVLRLCSQCLVPGGTLLAKVFEGEDLEALEQEVGAAFREVRRVVPRASRKASSEVYLLARGYCPQSSGDRGDAP
jgi:23S rRNA (uridine2552-2'-O)-methyltransferase